MAHVCEDEGTELTDAFGRQAVEARSRAEPDAASITDMGGSDVSRRNDMTTTGDGYSL